MLGRVKKRKEIDNLKIPWIDGDEAFYFLHKDIQLQGAVLTHVDNFNLAGTEDFVKKVLDKIEQELTVSKVEKDKF